MPDLLPDTAAEMPPDRAKARSVLNRDPSSSFAPSKPASSHFPKNPVPPVRKISFPRQLLQIHRRVLQDMPDIRRRQTEEMILRFAHGWETWMNIAT